MLSAYRRLLTGFAFVALSLLFLGDGQASDAAGYYSPDLLALQGRWVRDDAPYIIELRQGINRTLQATYFNRRFIHVEKTETAKQDGLHYVMIRLQDVNYAGSTYLLSYNRTRDSLEGLYIHGASGQRYQVSFSRQASGQ